MRHRAAGARSGHACFVCVVHHEQLVALRRLALLDQQEHVAALRAQTTALVGDGERLTVSTSGGAVRVRRSTAASAVEQRQRERRSPSNSTQRLITGDRSRRRAKVQWSTRSAASSSAHASDRVKHIGNFVVVEKEKKNNFLHVEQLSLSA